MDWSLPYDGASTAALLLFTVTVTVFVGLASLGIAVVVWVVGLLRSEWRGRSLQPISTVVALACLTYAALAVVLCALFAPELVAHEPPAFVLMLGLAATIGAAAVLFRRALHARERSWTSKLLLVALSLLAYAGIAFIFSQRSQLPATVEGMDFSLGHVDYGDGAAPYEALIAATSIMAAFAGTAMLALAALAFLGQLATTKSRPS